MSIQAPQQFAWPKGEAVVWTWDHTVSMSGWTLVVTLTGPSTVTKTPTIGTGPNGANTRLTVDYAADGTSKAMAAGLYAVTVHRNDAGAEGLKASGTLQIVDQG